MRDFLEGRFEVGDRDTRATARHAAELGLQDLLQDETVCRLHPGVQVQRRQYGLQRIHQQCWLFAPSALVFTPPEPQMRPQLQGLGCTDQVLLTDQESSQLGKLSLPEIRIAPAQLL